MKTINLTYFEIGHIIDGFSKFEKQAQETKLKVPAKVSYALHRNQINFAKRHLELNEIRTKLLDEHALKDKDGEFQIEIPPATVKDPNPMPVLLFKEGEEQVYNEKFQDALKKQVAVELYVFPNVEQEKFPDGDHDTLSILWGIIDFINDLYKKATDVK